MNNTMTNPSPIERAVMKRVRRMRILQRAFSNASGAALVMVFALWGIAHEVWVAKVFSNGPQDAIGHINYIIWALIHTRTIVQVLSLSVILAFVVLARESAQMFVELFTSPRHAAQ